MKLTEKVRAYWHDFYYYFASDRGVQFAVTCKDFSEQVDVGRSSRLSGKFRFFLHLSVCQGCKNYSDLTVVLRSAIRNVVSENEKPVRLERLNNELVTKHSRKNLS